MNILFDVTDNIGIIKINNPPGNFLVKPEFMPIDELKNWIDANHLKGILVGGTGRHFSGGAKLDDLYALAKDTGKMHEEMDRGKILLNYIKTLNIPVIAAIQGSCFGGGLEIALACHIRICSENALFAFPEINQQLMPGLGGIGAMKEKSSFHEAMAFILGGDMINAEEALCMKIVDQIVPYGELFNHSFTLLKKMTSGRELKVIHYVMKALHNTNSLSKEDAMKEDTVMFCELAKDVVERRKKGE